MPSFVLARKFFLHPIGQIGIVRSNFLIKACNLCVAAFAEEWY